MFHKRLLREFKENKNKVVGMVATQWLMLLLNVWLMITASEYVANLLIKGKQFLVKQESIKLFIVLAMVIILRSVLSYGNSILSFQASTYVKNNLRDKIYGKLMVLGSKYHERFKTSEIVQITTEGVEQLEIYFGKYIPQFFYSMLAPLTLFVIVAVMNFKVAFVLLICVPLIPVSIVAVQKFAKKMLAKYWGTYTELGDSFLECLQGLTTLKIYKADERYAKKMDEESEKFRKVTMRVLIMQLNSISIMDLVAYGGCALGIVLSILEYEAGQLSLAQCFFIVMISAEFFLPLRLLGSFFHIAMNGNAAADKIFRLLDEMVTVSKAEGEMKDAKVVFEDVSFSYEEGQSLLKQVNITANRGMTALVGASGCGKSTMLSLLMKNHSIKQGDITIGGVPLLHIPEETLFKQVTRIRHNSYLFAGTVKENLLMGNENASEKALIEALKQVNLWEYVKENGGLLMPLLEQGSNLSGGQKQRLAVARALLHNSAIYLFDEATSNVDVESENDIMKVIQTLAKEKTIIVVSHRLANIVNANEIYMLKDGSIVESGNHESLLEKKGAYANLYKQQKELEQLKEAKS